MLLRVTAPEEPADFADFWRERYERVQSLDPCSKLIDTGRLRNGWRVLDWSYESTDGIQIRGWVLLPVEGVIKRGFLIAHGYGGREEPDFDLPLTEAALFFPCARGLGRSRHHSISDQSYRHVLHDVDSKECYILGKCVEDTWLAVSAALHHFPELKGHLGYLGISFGGGVGAMAIAWDERIERAHFNVPTFGHHPLRLTLGTQGSAAAIQQIVKNRPQIMQTLRYYDAAIAAKYIHIPVNCACALFDPSVAPAGQFAIYNAITAPKELFLLTAGHFSYPNQQEENAQLWRNLNIFFRDL